MSSNSHSGSFLRSIKFARNPCPEFMWKIRQPNTLLRLLQSFHQHILPYTRAPTLVQKLEEVVTWYIWKPSRESLFLMLFLIPNVDPSVPRHIRVISLETHFYFCYVYTLHMAELFTDVYESERTCILSHDTLFSKFMLNMQFQFISRYSF